VRYVHVNPKGEPVVQEGGSQSLADAGLIASIDCLDGTVWYDGQSSGAYNWQAQRLLRDRLTPEDRVMGDVIVTGPVVNLEGFDEVSDVPEETVAKLQERYDQHVA
jgi:hypothetical protein